MTLVQPASSTVLDLITFGSNLLVSCLLGVYIHQAHALS